ncbi:hypothetical protein LEP1GSC188_0241 [Leptospira weilii serovar Topaz str. LT2116]|uniref:Uncharacterized protein n=1 Tax=Leptospira weilii serovar Topaz str. LT2116 TaxID=1088540 RepID=M3H000_9LEPT|nr:hypothetical protein LEP1GSC188_0241 [Leptospira weilii serovar Topaz str. LT2116]
METFGNFTLLFIHSNYKEKITLGASLFPNSAILLYSIVSGSEWAQSRKNGSQCFKTEIYY